MSEVEYRAPRIGAYYTTMEIVIEVQNVAKVPPMMAKVTLDTGDPRIDGEWEVGGPLVELPDGAMQVTLLRLSERTQKPATAGKDGE